MILVLIFMTIGKGDIAIVCASPLELEKFLLNGILRFQLVYFVKEFFSPIRIVGRNGDYGKPMCPAFLFHTRAVVDQEINPESGRVFAAWRGLEIVSIQIDDAVQVESMGMKQT